MFLIPLMVVFVPLCFWVQVRHRWCELVVKHAYTKAYGDVEHFLVHDQVNTHNCLRFDLYGTMKSLHTLIQPKREAFT